MGAPRPLSRANQRTCRNIDPAEAQRRIDAGEPIPSVTGSDRGDVIVHDAVRRRDLNARGDDFIIFRPMVPNLHPATVVDDAGMGITLLWR